MSENINVMVVFSQAGEHVHSWESVLDNLDPLMMLEAACTTELVDPTLPLDFIVYDDDQDDGVELVLMQGQFHAALIGR